jgi:hypothetical protein
VAEALVLRSTWSGKLVIIQDLPSNKLIAAILLVGRRGRERAMLSGMIGGRGSGEEPGGEPVTTAGP